MKNIKAMLIFLFVATATTSFCPENNRFVWMRKICLFGWLFKQREHTEINHPTNDFDAHNIPVTGTIVTTGGGTGTTPITPIRLCFTSEAIIASIDRSRPEVVV